MKNKKGFTLVELLAVVALLAVLATVVTPAITAISKKSKQKMYDSKIKVIESAAVMCAEKNNDREACDTVGDLCEKGYLSIESGSTCQKNPVNDSELKECHIDITKEKGRYIAKFNTTRDNCKRD